MAESPEPLIQYLQEEIAVLGEPNNAKDQDRLDEMNGIRYRLNWAASGMCRQVRLIWPPSFGHGRRCLRVCVLV
jgi:hypothetical protein